MKNYKSYVSSILGISTIVGAVVFIGYFNTKTNYPAPIEVDGETINFTWTDDNTSENLHIYTDTSTYSNGLSHATVYVAVVNKGEAQDIELLGYFRDNKKSISDVAILSTITTEELKPVYTETCRELSTSELNAATSTVKPLIGTSTCEYSQTGTTTELITKNKWVPLPVVERVGKEIQKETSWLSKGGLMQTMKSVDNFTAARKSSPFTIAHNEVLYYKFNIDFPANEDDNFFFVAQGSEGGYGHLDPWFSGSWLYRVPVNVVAAKVGSSTAITNFPVYLDLGGMPAAFWTNASSTGADIRVTKSDGSTEIAFEVVSFATTTSRGELHFLADSLSTTSTSTFYIYYGNAAATAYANNATYGRNNVWAGYKAVYHLGDLLDSTGNYDLTNNGTVTFTAGLIGNAASIQTAGQYLSTANTTGLTSASTPTFSYFMKMPSETIDDRDVFNMSFTGATGADIRAVYEYNAGARRNRSYRSPVTAFSDVTGNLADNTWKYGKISWVSGANGTISSINNGTNALGNSSGTTVVAAADQLTIGSTQQYTHTRPIVGLMDEFRVASSVLSSSWSITEYNNMTSTSTFMTIGAQELGPTASRSEILWFD